MKPKVVWTDLAAVAMTTWMGVHALRAFFSMVVWNIGEDLSPNQLGLIALGFWAIGLLAWPIARWFGGSRPEVRFGLLFSAIYAVNHLVAHPIFTPALGVAAAVTWLWLFPAVVTALGKRGVAHILLPGILLGLTAQVAIQAAMQGLDLPVLRGPRAGMEALLLSVALFASILQLTPSPLGGEGFPGWGLAALGPYLALQLTLLTNLGRAQILVGRDLSDAAALVLLALVAACAITAWNAPPLIRILAALTAVALFVRPSWLYGAGFWRVAAAQVTLAIAVVGALVPSLAHPKNSRSEFSGTPSLRAARVYGWTVAAAMLFFVLIFLFYSRYGWPQLWVVMAALAAVPALVRRPIPTAGTLRAAAAGAVFSILGLAISFGGGVQAAAQGSALEKSGPAPRDLNVSTYNIHEAFNYWSIPDPETVARAIENLDADLIGLQEVGRGWNINGGPDLVAWLRWRLPQYRLVYAPMLGDVIGHVILSRYPIKESGWRHYPRRTSRLSYGLTWAIISTSAGDLLFVTTHFSPYAEFASDRAGQAGDLLAFWQRRPRTILAGDFNAEPTEAAIQQLLHDGLRDVTVPHGLGGEFTYASGHPYQRIDYIFSSPDVESLFAAIPQTTASDHLPVVARVRLR